jgi:hypothetical protein
MFSRCCGAISGRTHWADSLLRREFKTTSSFSRSSAGHALGEPAPAYTISCGPRFRAYYHFQARIQSFQDVAAPFPGDLVADSSRTASPRTTLPFSRRQPESLTVGARPCSTSCGSRLPSPYRFPARQCFQVVAAPFAGGLRCCRQALSRCDAGDRNASVQIDDRRGRRCRTNIEHRRNSGKTFFERLAS